MAADGSILVVRIFGRLMNLDAFFAFSAMRVRFIQVIGRAFSDRRASPPQRANGRQALWRCRRRPPRVQPVTDSVQCSSAFEPSQRM
ncbi:hypothetical protein BZL54_10640 [Burkholderia ubonensis subsp. mesacidophila]|uniref:Uncharacterized protein n=2 Tax=Burkholderia ubonensis TaxID=101571 RepID=A0A2A4FIF7_9BURK|nr:hypothetical protein BZL54_10640 [Burkholderia ubonensis subsp. mesacidophila]